MNRTLPPGDCGDRSTDPGGHRAAGLCRARAAWPTELKLLLRHQTKKTADVAGDTVET